MKNQKTKGKDIITEDDEVEDEPSGPGFFEQLAVATETIGKFVYKNSYIFTNVVMMVKIFKYQLTIFPTTYRFSINCTYNSLGASFTTHGLALFY